MIIHLLFLFGSKSVVLQNHSRQYKTTMKIKTVGIKVLKEILPNECTGSLQCADPDDGVPRMAFEDLLSPPGVQVPDVDPTLP